MIMRSSSSAPTIATLSRLIWASLLVLPVGCVTTADPPASPRESNGGLTAREITGVVNQGLLDLRSCYRRSLEVHPQLRGKMTVTFVISEADGSVKLFEIKKDSVLDLTLRLCVERVIRGWEFPRPRKREVTVNYPFVFSPHEDTHYRGPIRDSSRDFR